ncbi:MAG: type I 3-dehydroquinate dehydratase [Spirochaetales bacterium]|nr:type I 3-dehydroquinate dehydratase [Spirochaetales bacterium]
MICLSLTGASLKENLSQIERYREYIQIGELRADFLRPEEYASITDFPELTDLPLILTIRKRCDGGHWDGSEVERLNLIEASLKGKFTMVDLEEDLPPQKWEEAWCEGGGRIVRSFHDFKSVPEDLIERMKRLPRSPFEIAKAAVMPNNTSDLLNIFKAAEALKGREKILLGMGDIGLPTRLLSRRMGCLLTFSSAVGTQAAPGQLDPETMERVYHFSRIDDATKLYGIIGDPVMHTRSPLIHNGGYEKHGLNALYLPFQIDQPGIFLDWAYSAGFLGFSVTVPHKQVVIPLLSDSDSAVDEVGSCNTLLRTKAGWHGFNTDVFGFLSPLVVKMGEAGLKGLTVAVIGAGGAARAVVYALVKEQAIVTIYNRTLSRAEALALDFGVSARLLDDGREMEYADLIVQTSVVGMAPHYPGNPISQYPFSGSEIAYDIIYSPEKTDFLDKAGKAGCDVIGGMDMLKAQGAAQFRLFTGEDL